MTKLYGLNWEKELKDRKPTDHRHLKGISPISVFVIPVELREKYLAKGERQNIGDEKMDCVSRAVCNWYENELNYAYQTNKMLPELKNWLLEKGYVENGTIVLSDVWVALGSGTTPDGNSLKAPIDFAYRNGMLPKKLLPQLSDFDENYDPKRITQEMKDLAKEFHERFTTGYEQIHELQFSMNTDGAIVALYAWLPPVDGVYQRTDLDPNHCVYKFAKFTNHKIADNYEENPGDFIKDLASNFNFMDYGYLLYFKSQQNPQKKTSNSAGIFSRFFRRILSLLGFSDKTFGAKRSSKWREVRAEHLKQSPTCAVCGRKKKVLSPLEAHHKLPFHLDPSKELEPSNLITVCRTCHLLVAHLGNFSSYNIDVEKDAKYLLGKIQSRP